MHRSAYSKSGNVFKHLATSSLDASSTQCANLTQHDGSRRISARYITAVRHAPSARRWRQVAPLQASVCIRTYIPDPHQAETSSAHLLIDAYDDEHEVSSSTEQASKQREGSPEYSRHQYKQELRADVGRRPVERSQWTARLHEEEALLALPFDTLSETDFNGFDSSIGKTIAQQNEARERWKTSLLAYEASYQAQISQESMTVSDVGFVKFGRLSSEAIQAMMPRLPEAGMPSLPMPWALREDERGGMSGSELLSAELKRFEYCIQPDQVESEIRRSLVSIVRNKVHASMKNLGTIISGSSSSGLATALSDIDIGIIDRDHEDSPLAHAALQDVYAAMTDKSINTPDFTLATLRQQKHSIINAQHRASGLDVQITAGPSTERQSRTTKYWLHNYPFVKPLFMVIRTALSARGLLDTYTGGLGSWTLLNMIMACVLRQEYVRKLPTLADQLLHILQYLGTFPFDRWGLCSRDGRLFSKNVDEADWTSLYRAADTGHHRDRRAQLAFLRPGYTRRQWLMSLQDLSKPERILGQSTTSIEFIQDTFRYLHLKLKVGIKEIDEAKAAGQPWRHESLLEPVVGRIHEIEHVRRARLVERHLDIVEQAATLNQQREVRKFRPDREGGIRRITTDRTLDLRKGRHANRHNGRANAASNDSSKGGAESSQS